MTSSAFIFPDRTISLSENGRARSGLQVEARELEPVEQHDLALGIADETEDAELVQPR